MANLEFLAGTMSFDHSNPPEEDTGSISFNADGAEHQGGWTRYVPSTLVGAALTTRMEFIDGGVGAGVVPFAIEYFATNETTILLSGATTLTVTVPNIAGTLFYVDLDMTGWIPLGTTLFLLQIKRDSSAPADTYAHDLAYFAGRTLEV
jgi:hypothetical protein